MAKIEVTYGKALVTEQEILNKNAGGYYVHSYVLQSALMARPSSQWPAPASKSESLAQGGQCEVAKSPPAEKRHHLSFVLQARDNRRGSERSRLEGQRPTPHIAEGMNKRVSNGP